MEIQPISSFSLFQASPTTSRRSFMIYSLIILLFCSIFQNANAAWNSSGAGLSISQTFSLAIDPVTSNTVYVGGYGLFKSTDGGANWSAANNGLDPTRSVTSIVIDPSSPSTIYVISYGDGIFKSTDGGAGWTSFNTGLSDLLLTALAIDPVNPNILYIGSYYDGIFKSTDGGATWVSFNTGIGAFTTYSLTVAPDNTDIIYAGTLGGLFKSTNGGTNWGLITSDFAYVADLVIDPTNTTTLYAAPSSSIFKSIDAGASWVEISTGINNLHRTVYELAIDPTTPTTLYANTGGGGGVYKSTDSGANWFTFNTGITTSYIGYNALIIDPITPGTLYAGGGGTVSKYTPATPIPMQFNDSFNAALNTLKTSNNVFVNALEVASVDVSVTGGEYSINYGSFTAAAGTVSNGDSLRLRTTSSSAYNTTVDAIINVGDGRYSFSVTTLTDTIPDAFNFNDQTNVALNTLIYSDAVVITGLEASSPISITGGYYSVNGGTYYPTIGGFINNNDSVTLRTTSSSSGSTPTDVVLNIGGVSDTFSVTTGDSTPNQFSYYDRTGAQLNTLYNSTNSIQVSGINIAAPISVSGGEYNIDGGTWTSASGTVSVFSRVLLRQTSATTNNTQTDTVLTIGGVSATFSTTTKAFVPNTTPNQFSFYDRTGAQLNRLYNSTNSIQVSGINADALISITGGEYSIDGGIWTSAAGTVSNLSRVLLRQTSAATNNTQTDTVLTIGGVSATFSTTTKAFVPDTTPNQFSFYDRTGAQLNRLYNSTNSIQVSGMTADAAISISGGEYSIDGGAWTSVAGTVSNLSRVLLRQTSASTANTQTDTVLTIGGVSATFSITTAP